MPIVVNNSLISNYQKYLISQIRCLIILNKEMISHTSLFYGCYCRWMLSTLLLKALIPIKVYDLINIVQHKIMYHYRNIALHHKLTHETSLICTHRAI